jgi:hypothetical protein
MQEPGDLDSGQNRGHKFARVDPPSPGNDFVRHGSSKIGPECGFGYTHGGTHHRIEHFS